MNRRNWIRLTSAAATLGPAFPADDEVKDLFRRSIVVDGLANAGTFNIMWPPQGPITTTQLANIVSPGITAINHTVTIGQADFEAVVAGLAFWERQVENHPDRLCVVRRHSDLQLAKQQSKLGLIFGFHSLTHSGECHRAGFLNSARFDFCVWVCTIFKRVQPPLSNAFI